MRARVGFLILLWSGVVHAGVVVPKGSSAKAAAPSAKAPQKNVQKNPGELAEVIRILTKGKGPTVDKAKAAKQKFTVMDPKWDPKRAWLIQFKLQGQKVAVTGGAATMNDVLQFAKRIQLSKFFSGAVIQKGERKQDKKRGEYYEFVITMNAPDADAQRAPFVVHKTP